MASPYVNDDGTAVNVAISARMTGCSLKVIQYLEERLFQSLDSEDKEEDLAEIFSDIIRLVVLSRRGREQAYDFLHHFLDVFPIFAAKQCAFEGFHLLPSDQLMFFPLHHAGDMCAPALFFLRRIIHQYPNALEMTSGWKQDVPLHTAMNLKG